MSKGLSNSAFTESGIDRVALIDIKKRFLEINDGRISRALQGLNDHQRAFLQIVPIFLHVNHPLLPGYVSADTPCGIAQFEPSNINIRALKNVVKSYEYRRNREEGFYLESLFLMGSTGTVAHSGGSDMDFWVCHRSDLSPKMLKALRSKLDLIQVWAEKLSLEVYFFTMDAEKFKAGEHSAEVGEEDCGSAQRFLLLDEFYRSNLLIAGKYPLWWMVPPEHEVDYDTYANWLTSRRFINEDEVIDFGGIPKIPAGEFFGAGLWQLYKAIDSPFKSVLKIILTETYAQEYPNVSPISMIFKEAVHQGLTSLDQLDPYLMVYRKIESYLKKNKSLERLDLVRRCFYLKVNAQASKEILDEQKHWRRASIQRLAEGWGWNRDHMARLDARRQWKTQQVISERKSLVNELNLSYRFLTNFARQYKKDILINQQDLSLIGRKLHAAFERKKGKIERINPKIAPDISEDYITIGYEQDESFQRHLSGWLLFSGMVDKSVEKAPLRRSHSLLELLAWAYFNKIIDRTTRFHLQGYVDSLTIQELVKVLHRLEACYPDRHVIPDQKVFKSSAKIKSTHFFINLGMDPLESTSSRGHQLVSENTDAFRYSGIKSNLVQSLDQLVVNSWGEVVVNHFQEGDAVVSGVEQYLRDLVLEKGNHTQDFFVDCYCASRPDSIANRLRKLFEEINHCFLKNKHGLYSRYILNIGSFHYIIQCSHQKVRSKKFRSVSALLKGLLVRQKKYSPIVIDSFALRTSPLLPISNYMEPGNIQIFYQVEKGYASVYLVDEMGSVFCFNTHYHNESHFIAHTYHFLRNTLDRMRSDPSFILCDQQSLDEIEFFELVKRSKSSPYNVVQKDIYQHIENKYFLDVQAIIEQKGGAERGYTIYVDHVEFNQLEHGTKIFDAVASHVISLRPSGQRYPVYITNLDISGLNKEMDSVSYIPIYQYMNYKQALEQKINSMISSAKPSS